MGQLGGTDESSFLLACQYVQSGGQRQVHDQVRFSQIVRDDQLVPRTLPVLDIVPMNIPVVQRPLCRERCVRILLKGVVGVLVMKGENRDR